MPEAPYFGPLEDVGFGIADFDYDGFKRWVERQQWNFQMTFIIGGDIVSSNWDGTIPVDLSSEDTGASAGFALDSSVGSAQFEGDVFVGGDINVSGTGTFGAGTALLGDIYSSTWDGTIPLDLSSLDSGATAGFALDSSEGAAQFMGDLFLGGNLTLSTGGAIRSASSGTRIELEVSDSDQINLYSGDASETAQGFLNASATLYSLGGPGTQWQAPTVTGAGATSVPFINLSSTGRLDFEGDLMVLNMSTDGNVLVLDTDSGDAKYIGWYQFSTAPGGGTFNSRIGYDGTNFTIEDDSVIEFITNSTSMAQFGTNYLRLHNGDSAIYANSGYLHVYSSTSNLYLDAQATGGDIYLRAGDGGGTLRTRILVDGSGAINFYNDSGVRTVFQDNATFRVGTDSADTYTYMQIQRSGIYGRLAADGTGFGLFNISTQASTGPDIAIKPQETEKLRVTTGQVLMTVGGDASAPDLAFRTDTDTGFYRTTANETAMATGGSRRFVFGSTNKSDVSLEPTADSSYDLGGNAVRWSTLYVDVIIMSDEIRASANGTASDPAYTFVNDTDAGMYLSSVGRLALSVGSVEEFAITTTVVDVPNVYNNTGGTANVVVASGGILSRDTSIEDWKDDIRPWVPDGSVWDLEPITFYPKRGNLARGVPMKRYGRKELGFGARKTHSINPKFVVQDNQGLNLKGIVAALLGESRARFEALEARVAALEAA